MSRPKPLEPGDQAHLRWGSLRWSIARAMRLVVAAHGGHPQYDAVLAGADVELTREQVQSFVPPSRWPATINEHGRWMLRDNDTLAPRA